MKKVVNITIGGVVFAIEEDAYAQLHEYLESIRAHFRHSDEQNEIVDDIELSIAEKFARGKDKKVIRITDVEAIIAEMGSTEDFKQIADDMEAEEPENGDGIPYTPRKKLYRNTDDQIIAGVASGIAAYFGVDPVFIRLLFVLSIFFNGIGILAYLILWIVMPAAETVSQKMEMQGEPVTLRQFEKLVKEKISTVDTQRHTSTLVRILAVPFSILKWCVGVVRTILSNIGPWARIIFGVLLMVFGIIDIIALTVGATILHFGMNAGFFATPLYVTLGSTYALGVISGYVLLFIPAAVAVIAGWSLVKKENKFTGVLTAAFVLAWIAALFGVGHAASSIIPEYRSYYENMPTVEQVHELETFDTIRIHSGDTVRIEQGDVYAITLEGKEESVAQRTFAVHNGVLVLDTKEQNRVCIGCFNAAVDVVITTPTLTALEAKYGTNVVIDELITDTLTLDFSHASNGNITVTAETVSVDLTHSSDVILAGVIDTLDAELWYASHLSTTDVVKS